MDSPLFTALPWRPCAKVSTQQNGGRTSADRNAVNQRTSRRRSREKQLAHSNPSLTGIARKYIPDPAHVHYKTWDYTERITWDYMKMDYKGRYAWPHFNLRGLQLRKLYTFSNNRLSEQEMPRYGSSKVLTP